MRKIGILIIVMLLLLSVVCAETSTSSINWLSRGYADQRYCRQYGDCIISNLSIVGDYINITVITWNTTATILINGTSIFDLFVDEIGDTMTGALLFNNQESDVLNISVDSANISYIRFPANNSPEVGLNFYNYDISTNPVFKVNVPVLEGHSQTSTPSTVEGIMGFDFGLYLQDFDGTTDSQIVLGHYEYGSRGNDTAFTIRFKSDEQYTEYINTVNGVASTTIPHVFLGGDIGIGLTNPEALLHLEDGDVIINATNTTTWKDIDLHGQVNLYNPYAGAGSQHWNFYPTVEVQNINRIAGFQNQQNKLQIIGIGNTTSTGVCDFFLGSGNVTCNGNIKPATGIDFLVASDGTRIKAEDLGDDLAFSQLGGTTERLIMDWASDAIALKSDSGLDTLNFEEMDLTIYDDRLLIMDADDSSENYLQSVGNNLHFYTKSGGFHFHDTDGAPSTVVMWDSIGSAVAMRFDQELQYMRGADYNISAFDNPADGENPIFIQGGDGLADTGQRHIGWQVGNGNDDWFRLLDVGNPAIDGLKVEMPINTTDTVSTPELIIDGDNDLEFKSDAVSGINPQMNVDGGGILYFSVSDVNKLYLYSGGLSYYGEVDMQLGTSASHAGGFRQQTPPTAADAYVYYGVPSSTVSDTRYGIFGDWTDRGLDTILGDQTDPTLFFQSNDRTGHMGLQHDGEDGRIFTLEGDILLVNNTKVLNDLNVTGNFTGNNFYAEGWGHSIGEVSLPAANTYRNVTNISIGELNGWQFDGGNFTAGVAGLYSLNAFFAFSGTPNNEYHLSITVNGVQQDKCHTERVIGTGGDVGSAGFTCLYRFAVNDVMNLVIENADSAGNPDIHDININVVRIGE